MSHQTINSFDLLMRGAPLLCVSPLFCSFYLVLV